MIDREDPNVVVGSQLFKERQFKERQRGHHDTIGAGPWRPPGARLAPALRRNRSGSASDTGCPVLAAGSPAAATSQSNRARMR
jgi:hypothetical protein